MSDTAEPLHLKPIESADLPELISVPLEGLSMGRDRRNTVCLDASRFVHVSGFHVRLIPKDGRLEVEDLGSRNGTLVNGREVRRAVIGPGDVLQLGRQLGPRFVVVARSSLEDTLDVPPLDTSGGTAGRGGVGESTVTNLARALRGLKAHDAVRDALRGRERRLLVLLGVSVLALGFALGAVILHLQRRRDEEVDAVRRQQSELAERLERTDADVASQRRAFEAEKTRLEAQRSEIEKEIQRLESTAGAAADIAALREQLKLTSSQLERLEPLSLESLEREKQTRLERVLASVVFVEKQVSFRDRRTKEVLHVSRRRGVSDVNFEGRGEPYVEEGGGSGFCISEDGIIVTNAHVVESRPTRDGLDAASLDLEPTVKLSVVFSGSTERLLAELIGKGTDRGVDLALLQVEPFQGIPHVAVDLSTVPPPPGTQVYVFGFPFGKALPQEGTRLTASLMSGTVSRQVSGLIQVQAAIYPGNSGGPVVSPDGRVVGVVTSVQSLPTGQIAAIGYILPTQKLGAIWPPR